MSCTQHKGIVINRLVGVADGAQGAAVISVALNDGGTYYIHRDAEKTKLNEEDHQPY